MLSPLTGLYATAVIKFYSETAEQAPPSTKINTMFALICFILCVAFLFAIFYAIFDFPFGTIRDKEAFKTVISENENGARRPTRHCRNEVISGKGRYIKSGCHGV